MEYALTNDENIFGILRYFINEPSVCKFIIKYKKFLENDETLEYYIDRWENIAGSHYILHDTLKTGYSLIFNIKEYIVNIDRTPMFYNLTGLSYQVVELIHELIKIKDNKKLLLEDDILYSLLGKKIMEKMKIVYT